MLSLPQTSWLSSSTLLTLLTYFIPQKCLTLYNLIYPNIIMANKYHSDLILVSYIDSSLLKFLHFFLPLFPPPFLSCVCILSLLFSLLFFLPLFLPRSLPQFYMLALLFSPLSPPSLSSSCFPQCCMHSLLSYFFTFFFISLLVIPQLTPQPCPSEDYTIAVCPGIANSSESTYVRSLVSLACSLGYRCVVLNHLGVLPHLKLTSPRVFRYG